jgi:hypothetical protein
VSASKYRDLVHRIMSEDPTTSTIGVQKRIAEEFRLPKLPSRSHVDTLRSEALFGLRREEAKVTAATESWSSDRLLFALWRNFARFTPSDYLVAEELVRLIESLASPDPNAHPDLPEYTALREAFPEAQAALETLEAPDATALRAKLEQMTRKDTRSVWPRRLTLDAMPLGRLSDWSELARIVELLRNRGAIEAA